MNHVRLLLLTSLISSAPLLAQEIQVVIRCDDIGMCHTVNTAAQQVLESGIPFSASVMFACPWYQEAVDLLRQHPEVSVGVHLTLNAEWKNYRWGPVAGADAVPSLVDSCGYFLPSRALLFGQNPKVEEVEKELRAQIRRAMQSGLRIDYLDYHMGAAVNTLELRELVERLAREYGLAISRYYGEQDVAGYYDAPPEKKTDDLLALASGLKAGVPQLFVFHIGLETPEMNALIDQNVIGPAGMSRHRHAELQALLSPEFRRTLKDRGAKLMTYRDLITQRGLETMRRPSGQ
jgi:chitin disaccharide deacetylase